VTLGEESVRPNDTKTSRGAIHEFEVAVHSAREGFDQAKRIAGAICTSLTETPLTLEAGRVVALRFLSARAERGRAPERRRVTLRFRAVVDEG
jgi:alkanesulfonate monooxygenase SsuD/methylene tetrahydromethanopterin reductase-like flavin-dependent oxidoreductase (luciferase family)